MKIKQNLKLFYPYIKNAKVFLLMCLIGGMTACKDVMEPEAPEKDQTAKLNAQYNETGDPYVSNDKFMQHLSDINGSTFYILGDDKIKPVTDAANHVNQLWFASSTNCDNNHDEHLNYSCYIGNPNTGIANRIDDGSVDSIATFDLGKTYSFIVDGCFADPNEDWEIYEIDEDSYNILKQKTYAELAQMAYERLTEVNADPGHINNICNAILAGKGRWEFIQDVVPVKSKGAKVGLQHSDFGLVQGTEPIQGETAKREHFPYSGGVESKSLPEPSESVSFKGKAYAVINDNIYFPANPNDVSGNWANRTNAMRIVSTDSAAATFAHGIYADTLTMPFKDWYTVKVVVKSNGQQMDCFFENYQSSFQESSWGLQNKNHGNLVAGTDTTSTGFIFHVAGNKTNNSEFSAALSKPDYYGASSDISTGLDNVYCAPARRNQSSNYTMPSEVVMQGVFDEQNITSEPNVKAGRYINFVFGGITQKQK